jgi:hypothetical protein
VTAATTSGLGSPDARGRGFDPVGYLAWALYGLIFEVAFLTINHLLGGRDLPQSPPEAWRFASGIAIRYAFWFVPLSLIFALMVNLCAHFSTSFRQEFPLLKQAHYGDWALYGLVVGAIWIATLYFGNGARGYPSADDTVPDRFAGFILGYFLLFLPLSVLVARTIKRMGTAVRKVEVLRARR